MLVQVQCLGDVAVLCLRSDLVLWQDAALQHVAVSAWGGTCLNVAALPLHSVRVDQISLFALEYVVLALVVKSPREK